MATIGSRVDESISNLEAQLHLWSTKLEEAKAKASDAGEEAKALLGKQLDEVGAKLQTARAKLDEAKAAGSHGWESIKDGVERLWTELEGTFKKLLH